MVTDLSLDISNQIYAKRLVRSDNEFCMICMYPTKICLFKKKFFPFNKRIYADWFYICEDHLMNEELLEPQNTTEVKELENEIDDLNRKLKTKNEEIDTEKQTWMDSAFSSTTEYISNKLTFSDSKKHGKEEKEEPEKDPKTADEIKVEPKTKKQEVADLLDNISARKDQLKVVTKQIQYFKLTNPTYRTRLETMARSLQPKKIPIVTETESSLDPATLPFPSAPTHNPL